MFYTGFEVPNDIMVKERLYRTWEGSHATSKLQVDFWNAVPTDLSVKFTPGVVVHPRIKALLFIGIS